MHTGTFVNPVTLFNWDLDVLFTEILLKLSIIKITSAMSVNNMHLIKPSIIYALQSDQAAFTKLSIFGIHCELIIVFILNLYQD